VACKSRALNAAMAFPAPKSAFEGAMPSLSHDGANSLACPIFLAKLLLFPMMAFLICAKKALFNQQSIFKKMRK
jgi:hypothetical protein